jgi:septin family protein
MEGWWQNESLCKFETPTSMFIVGPSNSGKTFFIKRLLEMSSEYHLNANFIKEFRLTTG